MSKTPYKHVNKCTILTWHEGGSKCVWWGGVCLCMCVLVSSIAHAKIRFNINWIEFLNDYYIALQVYS